MFSWLFGSNVKPKEISDAERLFTKEELLKIHQDFKASLKNLAGAKEPGLQESEFLHGFSNLPCSLDVVLGHALFNVVIQGHALDPNQSIPTATINHIILAKAHCERMGDEASRVFCFKILANAAGCLSESQSCIIPSSGLSKALAACSRVVLGHSVPQDQLDAAAMASICDNGQGLTIEGYTKWTKQWPAIHDLLSSLFKGMGHDISSTTGKFESHLRPGISPSASCGALKPYASLMPVLRDMGRSQAEDLLLQPFWTFMLSSCLPPGLRKEWSCLFNSHRDGKSFNTMMGRLNGCLGPTLILVKDKKGHIFGGFAPAPWVKSGTFFGDYSTFIFRLSPIPQLFRATGINDKFQWCGVGFTQLPNGIGFGGAQGTNNIGQFAMYIDNTLDSGMSRPIATFGNDPLGSDQVFQVAVVECWQLRPNEDSPSGHGDSNKTSSVLDRTQDRVLMDLAGMKVSNSDGLRPEPPIE